MSAIPKDSATNGDGDSGRFKILREWEADEDRKVFFPSAQEAVNALASVERIERRVAAPKIPYLPEPDEPVDAMAWLAKQSVERQCCLLSEAYSDGAYAHVDPAMFQEFKQIVGSQAGQRMLKYLERVAARELA